MANDSINFFNHNLKRLKNISRWLATGDFRRLARALADQFLIKTAPARRFLIKYDPFWKSRGRKRMKEIMSGRFGVTGKDDGLKVALILRDGTYSPKSSAFIRLISPLTHPSLKGKLSIKLYDEDTSSVDDDTDVCIVQRTAYDSEKAANNLLAVADKLGMSLILDSDDAFHDIDESHPEHAAHAGRVAALNRIIRSADQVWLSVPALAPAYSSVKGKLTVVKNSMDERLWGGYKIPARSPAGRLRLLYMGTATHDADLKMLLPVLEKLDAKYPGSFVLTLIGVADSVPDRPWIERLYQPKYGSINPNFVKWFRKQGPFDAGLSPLVDSEFNRGKSDIKCLDYLCTGVRPVVSDILPYQSPELDKFVIRVKNTPAAWEKALAEIVKDPAAFRAESRKIMPRAQDYIWQRRSSEQTAKQLFDLIQKSLSGKSS